MTYSNEAKNQLLDVSHELLMTYGAVSEQVVRAMAEGTLIHSMADLTLSITGIAGPQGGSAEKPVGLVWFGLAVRNGECMAREAYFGGGRKHVRRLSVGLALQWVIDVVLAL